METSGPYQPLAPGATWTFAVTDAGRTSEKVNTIEALHDIGGAKAGVIAYRSHSVTPVERQDTWYERDGDLVKRHRERTFDSAGGMKSEEWYDPYRLRIDESPDRLATGATWMWSYSETKTTTSRPTGTVTVTETWRVDAVDEPVAVPAGTFKALKLTHVDPSDGSTKTYWFVRGVGKVREVTSTGHLEELMSYQVPPP